VCLALATCFVAAAAGTASAAFGPAVDVATGRGGQPHVAFDSAGNAHFVWQAHNGTNFIVRTRRRGVDGTLGAVQDVTVPGGFGIEPDVSVDAAGNAHFVWLGSPASGQRIVRTRRLAADGTFGPVQDVSAGGQFPATPRLAVDAAGNAHFVWQQPGPLNVGRLVQTRMRTADGTLGAVQDLSATAQSGEQHPQLGVDAAGNAHFVWELNNGSTFVVQTRMRAANGALGPVQDLAAPGGAAQVAVEPLGDAHFVWLGVSGNSQVIQTRRRVGNGTLGAVQDLSASGQSPGAPQVALGAAGGPAHFVWPPASSTSGIVQARRRAVDLTLGPVQDLSAPGTSTSLAQVAVDSDGNAQFVWQRDGVVQTRRRAADGTLGAVKDLSPEGATFPEIAVDSKGNASAVWITFLSGSDYTVQGAFNPACAGGDSDGDALCDDWETTGIDFTGDGSIDLDLPAMGADPQHKDIFLQIDDMEGHGLALAAIDRVVAAFAAAPVSNPDGVQGVTLHVDNGPDSVMDPPSGKTWGSLSDAHTVDHQAVLGTYTGDAYNWAAFDVIKASSFSSKRRSAFHYVISGHRYGAATENSCGVSRGVGASDLLVTLGPASEPGEGSGNAGQQAGCLMHELGHNLGLRHGGSDNTNYNPGYLSIMNYSFTLSGLVRTDGTSLLDYSRFDIPLDEGALDEEQGFGFPLGSEPARFLSIIRCPNDPLVPLKAARLLAGPLDWDCDGVSQGQVAVDVNGDGAVSAFAPFRDWPALVYAGGAIGAAGVDVALPATTALIEPQLSELLDNQRVLEAGVLAGAPQQPAAGVPAGAPVQPPAAANPAPLAFGAGTRVTLGLAAKAIPATGPVKVRVSNANGFAVSGALSGETTKKVRAPRRKSRIKLKAKAFKVGANARTTVTLNLPKHLQRLLKRTGKLSLRLTANVRDPAGHTLSVKTNVSPRLKRRRR